MNPQPSRYEALLLVVEVYGSQQATADALGVSQPTVWRWVRQSKQLPPEYVLAAERDTGVSRHWLRPDIYPVEHSSPRFAAIDMAAPSGLVVGRASREHGNRLQFLDNTNGGVQ